MTRRTVEDLRRALGADVAHPVHTQPHGPFGVMQLAEELSDRLRPPAGTRAGRPTDPAWEVRRLVGFRRATWQQLARIAEQASTAQRRVSPAHVAALLIERGLEGLDLSDGRRSA